MLHSATWTGLRTLAGDYREGDIRRAGIRRANLDRNSSVGKPSSDTTGQFAHRPLARLLKLLPHGR